MIVSRGFRGRRRDGPPDRVPPGQYLTDDFPVLSAGPTPHTPLDEWTFTIHGVDEPKGWTWEELQALPRETVTVDIHCVTRWSKLDNEWEGVSARTIIDEVRPKPEAKWVLQHADPDYTTNTSLDDLGEDGVLLALKHNGEPLTPDHGGPVRLVLPKLYFWKSSKWLRAFEFLDVNPPGFWEQNGYHMNADPWREERYADQETRAMQQMRAEAARKLRDR